MMKWMPSAIAAILAAAAANALEIPAEVRLLYADERRQNPGIYEVVPKFEFQERNGLVRVDVLVSRKTEDGRWFFRNRLDRIFLKDGKIDAVRRPGAPGDFWSAALAAEKFLYADSGEQGKKLSFSELDGTGILEHTASVNVEKEYDIVLQYDDRYEIDLGSTDRLDYKVQYLQAILKELSDFQAGTIDLTLSEANRAKFHPKA